MCKDNPVKEDYEMLARENKNMAEMLSSIGYTNTQISDICNGVFNRIDKPTHTGINLFSAKMFTKEYQLWTNYGEGWGYDEFDTIGACMAEVKYCDSWKISRRCNFDIILVENNIQREYK